ncbi:MAG: DNA polymerase Y family protein [bacterium]
MDRLACVNVWALPLQLLLQRHPEHRGAPVAVTADDRVGSPILWANQEARRKGVRTGMRCAAAMALAGGLRTGVVSPEQVAAGVRLLTTCLQRFSPQVEPSPQEPGIFWANGSGLALVHGDAEAWAAKMHAGLREAGFEATVVVGRGRFAVYALAKSRRGCKVFAELEAERAAARRVPLQRLGVEPRLLEAWAQLAVFTVADFLGLPPLGLLPRFGADAYRLHLLAAELLAEPLQPAPEAQPVRETVLLDYPESDTLRLLQLAHSQIHLLIVTLARRRESLQTLHLRLVLEGAPPLDTAVRPAVPTRDIALIIDLMRLRLEGLRLAAGVIAIELLAEGEIREPEQLSLLADQPRRDLEAGSRALARIRAEFGEETVVCARFREGHMPEARFAWEPLRKLKPPRPPGGRQDLEKPATASRQRPDGTRQAATQLAPAPPAGQPGALPQGARRALVRRIFSSPRPLDCPPTLPNPWELGRALRDLLGYAPAPLARLHGPYPISGGWWLAEQHRDYYFAETRQGDLFWLHRDRRKGTWFLQGRVE